MKTLKERLDDLNKSLKEAKTLEEAKKISQEIEDISADAVKVSEALEKANKEAKESREKSDQLEIDNKALEEKFGKKKPDEDDPDKDKDKDKDKKPDPNETPAWAKTLIERLETIEKKDKSKDLSTKIKSALKEAKIPEKFAGTFLKIININEDDAEKIKDAVDTLKQSLNDEELKENFPPKSGDGKGSVAVDAVKDFAKEENKSSSSEIIGKQLIGE